MSDAGTAIFNNKVGIGTSAPIYAADIKTSGTNNGQLRVGGGSTSATGLLFEQTNSGTTSANIQNSYYATSASASLSIKSGVTTFHTGTSGTERMRIESDGSLLVSPSTETLTKRNDPVGWNILGASIGGTGVGAISASCQGTSHQLGRQEDGAILDFRESGALVGSIACLSDDLFIFSTASSHVGLRFGDAVVFATNNAGTTTNGAANLGHANYTFHTGYFSNGTSTGSDRNEKQDIAELTATELAVSKRLAKTFRTFKRKDAVVEKGSNARTHTGTIAQEVHAAFAAEGLDAGDYGMWISSTLEGSEYDDGREQKVSQSIRYEELLSFISAGAEQRLTDIETRLAALEG